MNKKLALVTIGLTVNLINNSPAMEPFRYRRLHDAIQVLQVNEVQRLLGEGAKVDELDESGKTPTDILNSVSQRTVKYKEVREIHELLTAAKSRVHPHTNCNAGHNVRLCNAIRALPADTLNQWLDAGESIDDLTKSLLKTFEPIEQHYAFALEIIENNLSLIETFTQTRAPAQTNPANIEPIALEKQTFKKHALDESETSTEPVLRRSKRIAEKKDNK